MNPWGRAVSLFHEVAAFEATAEARRQRRERASQGLADWYTRAEALLLEALAVELERRIEELGSFGCAIRVTSPSVPTLLPQGGSLRFLSVCFADEVVTAYSTRQVARAQRDGSASLTLHWAWQLRRPRGRFPRILSVPGIRVRRGLQQEMLLEALSAHPGVAPSRLGLSDIAAEILAMLAEAAASRRRLLPGSRTATEI